MTDPYRIAAATSLWLAFGSVSRPNAATRDPIAQSCDPKASLVLSAERRDSLSRKAVKPSWGGDDRLATLATSAPGGFAGAYLESSSPTATAAAKPQRLVVRLVRPQDRDTALKTLLPMIREVKGNDIDRGGVIVTSARWDLPQLFEWRRYLEPHAHAVAKVLTTDIDQPHNRITYAVATPADRESLLEHLGTLGVPCGLIHVVIPPKAG